MRMTLVVCSMAASVAFAQAAKPGLVVAPLEVDPAPALTKSELAFRNAFFDVVDRKSGAYVTSKPEAEAALTKTARQDFRESDESLSKFAEKAHTLYALHAWLQTGPKKTLVLTGRAVRDDGKLMKSATVTRAMGAKPVDTVKALTEELLSQLDIGSYPTTKEVAVVTPPPVETPPVEVKKDPPPDFVPPPPPPLVEVKDEGAGQRSAGQGLFATGLAVGAVGGIVAAVGGAIGSGVPRNENQETTINGAKSAELAKGLTTAGFVGAGVGAAAAIVGAIVWGTAKPPPVKVSAMPMAGGAYVQVGAEF